MDYRSNTLRPHRRHDHERSLHAPHVARVLAALVFAMGAWSLAQDAPTAPSITELVVVDAATGEAVRPVAVGDVLSFDTGASPSLVLRAEPAGPATSSIRFDIDGRPVHVDSEGPFELTLAQSGEGFAVQDPEASATTIEIGIASSQGDAEEFLQASEADAERYPLGYTYVQSSDLELGRDPDNAPQAIGLRFEGVAVPAGATITSAEIEFDARGDSSGPLSLTIRGEDSTAEPYAQDADATASAGLSQRETTTSSIAWELTEPWAANQPYASPDVAGIVQEIVDRSDWEEGAALGFLLQPAGGEGFRRAFAFDGSAQRAPVLRLTYAADSGDAGFAWGEHEIAAVPFAEPGASGAAGEAVAASVTIARDAEQPAADAAEVDRPAEQDAAPADADAAETSDPAGDAPGSDAPAGQDAAPAEPDAPTPPGESAEPEPVGAEPEGSEPEVSEPEGSPSAPERLSETVLRRERYPLLALEGGREIGGTLVSAYADGSSVITVTLDGVAREPYAIELWRGSREQPRELVVPLQPHRLAIGSVTPIAVGFSTLVLGNLSVLVMGEGSSALACSQLGSGR